jgi:hypothetical protein
VVPVAFVGAVDSLVAHNTIIDPNRWILRILQESVSMGEHAFVACGNNRFINNLCWFSRARLGNPVNIGPNTDAASFQFANNLWYAHDQPGRSAPNLPSRETNGIFGQDPQFNDVANADYSPRSTSVAVAKGLKLPAVHSDLRERWAHSRIKMNICSI